MKNINDIDIIENEIKKYNLKNNLEIKLSPDENEVNQFIEKIKILVINKYSFKKCPININEKWKFVISGDKDNIFIKTGTNGVFIGTICEYPLNQLMEEHI